MISVFHTEPMEKVRILALEQDRNRVVAALHTMGVIDLRKSKLQLGDDKPESYSTDISDALIRINGALQILEKREISSETHLPLEQILKETKSLKAISEAYELSGERKELKDDMAMLNNAEYIATSLSRLKVNFSRLKSDYVAYKAFEADAKAYKIIGKKIHSKEHGMDFHVSKSKKGYLIFIAYDKKLNLEEDIKDSGVIELDLGARYLEGMPSEVLKSVREKRAKNTRRLEEIAKSLEKLSDRNYSKLANLSEMLEIELSRADVGSMFKKTDNAFVIEGWIEKRKLGNLETEISKAAGGRAYVESIEQDELAPTHTNRPGFMKPFEYLMNFYSTQRSDEIDPTWIFFLSFPIFYGLMVTDVGYGLASLIFVTLVSKKVSPKGLVYNACKIWQMMSLAAIFFGFLSNQYFGFQLNQYFIPWFHGFDWMKNATSIIAITVLFGIVQIVLGLLFGFFNHYKRGHTKMAVSKLTSIAVIVFGTVAVSALFGFTSGILPLACAIAAVVSLLITAAISGHEATEITNLITHPLSYARIMGFGLGSVIIAFLIDQYFTPHLSAGILVFILYLIIFILLHFMNMILGIFEGIVQGVRLNFVEYFSKFYIGNGIRFKPFSYERNHTKEEKKNKK